MCNFYNFPQIDNDIWYCYTASCTGTVDISLCGSDYDTKLAVYLGCSCPSSGPIACNDDSCGLQSTLSFSASGGQSYLLRVGGYGGLSGSGTITISCSGGGGCSVPCPPGSSSEFEFDCGIPNDTVNGGCNSVSPAHVCRATDSQAHSLASEQTS